MVQAFSILASTEKFNFNPQLFPGFFLMIQWLVNYAFSLYIRKPGK